MASEERTALAELANELKRIKNILRLERYFNCSEEVDKAHRIIAELANVKFVKSTVSDEVLFPIQGQAFDALVACRAIAEDGAKE